MGRLGHEGAESGRLRAPGGRARWEHWLVLYPGYAAAAPYKYSVLVFYLMSLSSRPNEKASTVLIGGEDSILLKFRLRNWTLDTT